MPQGGGYDCVTGNGRPTSRKKSVGAACRFPQGWSAFRENDRVPTLGWWRAAWDEYAVIVRERLEVGVGLTRRRERGRSNFCN